MKKSYALISALITILAFAMSALANNLIETKSGLIYEELVIGNGIKATPQKIATVQLTIWESYNGQKGEQIYTSYQKDVSPLSFKLGTKKVSDGLNIGVVGMRVGGKRRLYVPSHLNPESTSGKFPGKADLIYEVELVDIK
jgi:FKBP-type peptidyl-prolyl cis-trans isomerase FkpA